MSSYRFISNDASRTAALLAGDVDFIDFVPTEDLEKLRKDPKVKLWETVGLRLIFLGLDQSRDGPSPFVSGPNGEKLDKNPLKDPRVRKALSLAINRQAIVDRVMEGAAVPSGQYLPPGVYSYAPDIKPPPYDPEQAKKLLAEAGFPKGLRIALHGPNDRYVNDAKIIQAIGQMWTRIGVQTEVDPLPWTSYRRPGQQAGVLGVPVRLGHRHGRGVRSVDRAECDVQSDQGLGRVEPRPLFQSRAGQADRAGAGHR